MTIEKVIEEEAIERAKEVAKIFGVKDFMITVKVSNVRSGKFQIKFESNSNGSDMARANVINAAAIVGIQEECEWNDITCDFSISVTVAD